MTNHSNELSFLQQQAKIRHKIEEGITQQFASEDEGLQYALTAARRAGLPQIQISPIQGKLLQLLATACDAHKILEIGSLGGYSGIWLARALPANGRFITLEINPTHANLTRNAFTKAGVSDRAEVRVGKALDLLPQLESEAPFDLVFIVGEMNIPDHGAALEHRGRALQLQILDQRDAVALGEQRAVGIPDLDVHDYCPSVGGETAALKHHDVSLDRRFVVIASEAKQSIEQQGRKYGLLRRFAPRNDARDNPIQSQIIPL